MMKTLAVGAALMVVLIVTTHPVVAEETWTYAGIRPTDPGGRNGLPNPQRGLRTEAVIGEPLGATHLGHMGAALWLGGRTAAGYTDDWWLADARRYDADGLRIIQGYFYLDGYVDRPIDDDKLACLSRSLSAARQAGYKFLMRVAYEKNTVDVPGPNLSTILGHLDQLRPLIAEHQGAIYLLQAGCIGAWGEWHHSAQQLENDPANFAAVLKRVLDVLPPGQFTQVRRPSFKQLALAADRPFDVTMAFGNAPAARVGFHNDGFLAGTTCGNTFPDPPYYSNPGNPEFDLMTEQSAYMPVDGEMFVRDLGGEVEGLVAASRLRLHHYATFSLAHSSADKEGQPYAFDRWRQKLVTIEQLRERQLPISDGYFDGAERTIYEYIRDHLGYRYELQKATAQTQVRAGDPCVLAAEVINRGFAVLHQPRPVYVALIGRDEIAAVVPTDGDPRRWQPVAPSDDDEPLVHTFAATGVVPRDLPPGQYRVGLWLPDTDETLKHDARFAVRLANGDTPWWTTPDGRGGVNVLGRIEVLPPTPPVPPAAADQP